MTADVRDRLRKLTEAQKDAALTAVLDLADELQREAFDRDSLADRLPNAPAYHREINRLVVAAEHQRRCAKRLRAVVAAAGDQP